MRTSSSLRSSAGTLRRIPQALSTVTTIEYSISVLQLMVSYNTASGKRCCNGIAISNGTLATIWGVTIPQAVSAVATYLVDLLVAEAVQVTIPQAVSAVATQAMKSYNFIFQQWLQYRKR